MDLDLTYNEAIDFIINLDLANLSHDNSEAYIKGARKILCSYLANGEPDTEKVITFTPEENYKFEPLERNNVFMILMPGSPFPRPAEHFIEKEKYSSDGIRAFMENKSLIERSRPVCNGWSVTTAEEAKQIAREEIKKETLQYVHVLKTLKAENNPETKTAFFREIGRKGGKARIKSELLKKFIEDFAKSHQSVTFEKAWKIWKKQKTITFDNAEINFTDTAVEIDGKTLKKPSVSRYFYDAKKVL